MHSSENLQYAVKILSDLAHLVYFLLAVDQSETKIQISGAIHLVNLRTPLKVYLIPLFMIIF